jgi:hypothetical protein
VIPHFSSVLVVVVAIEMPFSLVVNVIVVIDWTKKNNNDVIQVRWLRP